ncbi:LPXTG cell wall anchor domain-containing protein [Ignavigranum ruoffiae]|uniref:LPXTG cell wall anchor domain-containing protein n=1 Tax=Ignavigranum ruoffiae TaxID=89093 RepID=UPI0020600E28|nr:LPXTG cell wall anchor domain-containing protein [Ignavigranum ruoffiae]UPQ86615.1 LPXTG cell wall anchor domain-containing protein [Ignavigranum ruoffiae]
MRKFPITAASLLLSSMTLVGLTANQSVEAKTVEEVQAMIDQAPEGSVHTTVNENGENEVENTGDYYNADADPLKLADQGQLAEDPTVPSEERIVTGEFHNHTNQSNDASEKYMTLENVLNAGFREDLDQLPEEAYPNLDYGQAFDYYMSQDHFRKSPRNINGDPLVKDGNGYEKPTWKTIQSQIDKYNELKAQGKYSGKIYYPGFEWDLFGLDHVTVGIIEDSTNRVPLDAIRHFEWLYSYDTPTSAFTDNELEVFGPRDNVKADKTNAYDGLRWLQKYYPHSFFLVNHPSRHNGGGGEVRVEDIRDMLNVAPDIVAGLEGMPGNQMGGDRGEMRDIYGGADLMIAKVGGVWDSLLGEGRQFYNYANSDFHFKISSNGIYSSGYWPSEYSRNYTKVSGNTFQDISEGLKIGNSWSVYGDLISGLEFYVEADGKKVEMGGTLEVAKDTLANLTIRFKDTQKNNYKPLSADHRSNVSNHPILDHIDLIVGNIFGEMADKTTAENPTTRIARRFDQTNWSQADADGWHTIKVPFIINQDMYMRLRGTNHGLGVAGETDQDGNPLLDEELKKPMPANEATYDWSHPTEEYKKQMMAHFNRINDRNYSDLWFYANPIRLMVADSTYTIPKEYEAIVKNLVKDPSSINQVENDIANNTPTIPQPEKPEIDPELPDQSGDKDNQAPDKNTDANQEIDDTDKTTNDTEKENISTIKDNSLPQISNASDINIQAAGSLPETGEQDPSLIFTGAALSIIAGLGLIKSRKP